ncbi:hypothetical protein FGIG_03338 [Fasciola gigantica]|uniref:Pericentrin/AKAP-450 centrosomal targeting domain-containing protein n=1 Tax=Fasciola gigantica TaxID=46835 RepID=A0A504YTI6_FASGI|nr:hypothetical protein FGIG_03338 [Fasciola gigantica]
MPGLSNANAHQCAGCLELEAKLIADEVVASTEYEEVLRITNDRLNTSETRIKQLESELTQLANEKLSNPHLHNQSNYADIEDFNQLLTALSGSPNGGEQEDAAMYRSGYKILAPALTQLNQEVERLACALDAESINKSSVHDFLSVSSTVIQNETDRDAEIAELRNRLSTALQLLAERLPVDTRKALADTTQLVETERLQLQAELERRMVLFEQNHTSSLTELETSRRALVEQLAASEATNVQLRDELAVLTQKFQAKERFLTEQTDERELEREEFRAEVTRLESQLQAAKCSSPLITASMFLFLDTTPILCDRAQLLTSKLVNGISEPSDANCAWYTDSDDVEQTTPRRDKNHTTAGSKSRSRSAISKLARRATWTPDDEEVDIDDALRDSPLAVRSKQIVSPMSVERQASWFAPNMASIMTNGNDNSTTLDDLEPDSGGEELLPALRSAPYMSTVTIGTVNEKKVDHKAVHACVISGDVGAQAEDLPAAELELDHVSPYNSADACTQTKPDSTMNNVDATEGSATKTTTTRTVKHTLNGLTAAALFQRLSLTTEECTTVETGTPPSAELGLTTSALWGETSPSRDVSDLLRSWSTPSITSPSIGSTAGDTGVEMSRGMTMIESIESAGVLDETDSDNSPVPRPFSGPGKLSILSPRMETTPWSAKCPEGTVSGDEIHRSVEEVVTSLNTTVVEGPVIVNVDEGGSWSAVSSLAPTPGSVVEPFVGQISLSEGPLTTATHCPKVECFDAECETTDLGLETISTSELEDLLGQKEASELVISTMRAEIDSLTKYQNELQADYNTVQSMLDDRQAEVDRHTRETLALQDRCMILERQVNERKNVILERDEDLFLITEEKEALENKVTKLQEENELFRSKLSNENKVTLDANVQTEVISPGTSSVGTMVTHSLLVSSLAVFNHTMETNSMEENADTIQDDASSLHSLNMAEAEDLLAQVDPEQAQRIAPIECPEWVTSTPEHRSLLMPIDRNKVALPQELQTLVKRLREESLRLFSLASACQPSAVIWSNPDQCQPIAEEGSTLLDSNPTESRVWESSPPEHRQNLTRAQTEPPATRAGLSPHLSIPPHRPTVLTDLVRANTALKSTLKSLAQDHVHELVRCTANALASDELVWLGMLDWSLCQTTGRVSYSLRSGVPYADKSAETKIHQFVWTAIGRLVEQLSAFMRQEDKLSAIATPVALYDKCLCSYRRFLIVTLYIWFIFQPRSASYTRTQYRECLVQAHLVEQQCLNSELQTALNRVENLSLEIDRLTERLTSNKQALNRADGLNVQLANQVNNLKSELTSINEESKRGRTAANQTEPGTVNTSTYIVKQQQQTILVLRAQLDTVSTEKSALDKELADLKRALKEYKDLVNVERKRVEIAEQKLADWQTNWKEASDALGKAVHSAVPNTNGWALDSPVHSQKDNPNKASGGPDHSLSNADDLFHAISRAATNLAAARHTANKAERRARELQATNQSLRLSLAEAELRLMPLLVTVTNRDPEDSVNPSSAVPTSNTSSAVATVSESFVQDRSQPTASSRFAELKGMCSRLLSLATAEDRNSPSPDSSDDDEDGPQALLMLNSSPNKTPVHRKRHSHLTPSLSHSVAERDSGPSSRGYKSTVPTSSVFPTYTSNPHQTARTPLTIAHVPSLDQISSSSRPTTSEDQTVSVERKRYLVLLLGGFQFSEETVLASICRPDSTIAANTSPSSDGYPSPEFRTYPLRRFRVAVRAIAAIHRMYRMVYRWRRSGLHCPPSRGPNECISTAMLQTPTDPTVPPHLVHYSQLPRSRTSVPNLRTPLRELDVGMLDGVQQVMHPQSTITSIPYPTTFPAGWPETHSHLLKPLSFSTAHVDGSQTVVGPPTISNYTITTSCPRTSNRSQTNNYDSPVKSAIPRSADWATASSTSMSQTIVRSGLPYSSSAIPFDIHPVIRSSPVLCDTHSNHHHARFDRTTNGTSTRLSSTTTTATHRSDLRTGPDRRRSAVQTPISSRNGVSYTSPRLQTSPRSSLPTRRVNSSRPCRQPPFK